MQATGAALVVHDLKNALGALEAGLQALTERPERDAALAAHRQCRQLRQRLVGYLTVYGHAEANGELHAHLADESPIELLRSLAARHTGEPIAVRVAEPIDAPAVWHLDRHLVLLALEAALHNAARFARSAVWLSAAERDGHLVLTVRDDGPGPSGPASGEATTGLGTLLCRAVARAHGTQRADGGVTLTAAPEGGARFELWLAT